MRGLIEGLSAQFQRWGRTRLEAYLGLTGGLMMVLTLLVATIPFREAHELRERKVLYGLAQTVMTVQRDMLRILDAGDFALDRIGARALQSGALEDARVELPPDLRKLIGSVEIIGQTSLPPGGGAVGQDAVRTAALLERADPTVFTLARDADGTLFALQPLMDHGGYRGAYALAAINDAVLRAILQNAESPQGGELLLARLDGTILLHHRSGDIWVQPTSEAPARLTRAIEQKLRTSAGGEFFAPDDNRYYAYRRLAEYPLVLVQTVGASAARSEVASLNFWLGVGFLVMAGVLGVLTTGLVLMARALRRAHARKLQEAALFEATPDPVILLREDREGDFICERINPAATRLFGGSPNADVHLGALAAGEALRRVVEIGQPGGAPCVTDIRVAGAEVQLSARALPDVGDGCRRFALIGRELTEQRQAERALRERSLQLEAIFDSAMDAVLITDDQSRIVMFNKMAERMFGYAATEVVGQGAMLLVPARFRGGLHERFLRAVRRRGWRASGRTRTMLGLRKDGGEFPVEVSISRVAVDERQVLYAAILHDDTERYEAERAIHLLNDSLERRVAERTVELERAYKEMESFSYSVSHDLRAPLRAIHGYTFMLSDTEAAHLSSEGRNLLDKVMRASVRMGELIDDFLDFSRVGRAELARQSVDMGRLVSDVVSEYRSSYPDARVTVGLLPRVQGDPRLLRQVWRNLISNALKFSAHRTTPSVDIGVVREEGRTWFYVSDNGIGFDMAYADKLFGVFQRLHASRDFEGTGIGLAIVKRVVERHQGGVRAESAPGEGATFSFWIP